jgi:hypothetical protein
VIGSPERRDVVSSNEALRATRNQALYREVNEKIHELNAVFEQFAALSGTWVCECADEDCTAVMELTVAEYESLRAHPNRFAVLRGHVYDDVERVVEERDAYVIVEKLGPDAAYAIEHDPRREERRLAI